MGKKTAPEGRRAAGKSKKARSGHTKNYDAVSTVANASSGLDFGQLTTRDGESTTKELCKLSASWYAEQ